ncbi:MAG: hypothetical protein HY904_24335 [Deltaproteobacteria bacterium]|nr:hypothetical protein [Deltaproteobacteria bacterium]
MVRATALVLGSVLALLASGCGIAQEHWEGTLSRCDNNGFEDQQVLLRVDLPRAPSPTGWAGTAEPNDRDTWVMTEIDDSSGGMVGIQYEAFYDFNGATERWTVDLKNAGPTAMEGDVEIVATFWNFQGTIRCDLKMERKN